MVKKLRDLDRWVEASSGILFPGEALRTVSVTINPVGPAVARVVPYQLNSKGAHTYDKDSAVFLGVFDQMETLEITWGGSFAVFFEDAVEVWVLRDQTPLAIAADPDSPKFTRFEKQGLFVDDLGVALHRQAVLSRLANKQNEQAANVREAGLRQQLEELGKLVAGLTKAEEARVKTAEVKPEAKAEDKAEQVQK